MTSARDPRRDTPRTDVVLADPRLVEATDRLGRPLVKSAVAEALQRVRAGALPADAVVDHVVAGRPARVLLSPCGGWRRRTGIEPA